MVLRVFAAAIAACMIVSCTDSNDLQVSRALPTVTGPGTETRPLLGFSDDAGTYNTDFEPPQPAGPIVLD